MLKLLVLAVVLCVVTCELDGGWQAGTADQVTDLASWATSQMSQLAGFEGEYTVQKARNVQTQVVNGVNYKFTLDVVYQGADGQKTLKSCNLYIYDQPLSNTRKFIKAPECSVNQGELEVDGGWTQVNTLTDDILEVVQMTTKAMNFGDGASVTVVKVDNVAMQVVAGLNYKFSVTYMVHAEQTYTKTCNFAVNHQPWNNNKLSFLAAPVCVDQVASKRSLVGGWTQVDTITEDITEVAQLTGKAMFDQLGFAGQHTVYKVENVQKQVANGINYKFTVTYLVANGYDTYTLKTCDLHINYKAWNNNQITFLSSPVCRRNSARQEMLAGGWTQTNVITDEMMSLASWATSQLSAFTGVDGEHTVMTLRNMSTQVVSGINYKFTLDVLAQDSTGKYFFKSCDLFINFQSWTNSKTFVEQPKCGANPNFQ